MWKARTIVVEENYIVRFEIVKSDKLLTVGEVIDVWINDSGFRSFYNTLLATHDFAAFFWEHPPIENLDQPYEFVLVKSRGLSTAKPRPSAFNQYFNPEEQVVTFMNLGKDAELIVPCPITSNETYTHLGNFVRSAPLQQIDLFWKTVGLRYQATIGSPRKWLSTSGLGVYWLHVRLDSRPKYFKHSAYK